MTFRTSASALGRFFSCPAKYAYSRRFQPKELSVWLKWGLDAHALMEGEEPPYNTRQGWAYYKKLKALRDRHGYEIVEHEIEQVVDVMPGVEMHRRIDALARLDGQYVLLDWKTANKPWLYFQRDGHKIAPKGSGFQAAAYTLPPRDGDLEALGLDTWPESLHFVVAYREGDKKGDRFVYWRNQGDEKNLRDAIERLQNEVDRDVFVRNRGFGCKYCDFASVCYGVSGWQDEYELRD